MTTQKFPQLGFEAVERPSCAQLAGALKSERNLIQRVFNKISRPISLPER
jgi:hypothetical protein